MNPRKLFTTCSLVTVCAFMFSLLLISCSGAVKEDKSTADIIQAETPVATKSYNDYLTATDIEKVAGMTGVKLIPKDPGIGAGGNLNFAAADDNLIVMVQIVSKSYYEGFKEVCKENSEIKGLGDQAMSGATFPGYPENMVAFTKGNNCIALVVFGNMNEIGTNMLTIEQTSELAKIIASRL
jgi:hypothetical protein